MTQITWPPSGNAVTVVPWNFTGAYDPGTTYAKGDVATFGGSVWLAVQDDVGPGDIPHESGGQWALLVSDGDGGPAGASGAAGTAGAAGPPGASAPVPRYDTALAWTDVVMENDWIADSTDPPQWAVEADGTVWLRGVANNSNPAANVIIAHLPDAVLPPDLHYWGGATGGSVFGLSFTMGAHGAIGARGSSDEINLGTSYKCATAKSGGSGNSGVGP